MSTTAVRRCPYCFADLETEVEDVVGCAVCQTLHHRACFLEHGRCTLLGCTGTETTSDTAAPALELASLHPFLPLEEGLIERRASFLSVRAGERDRRKRRGEGRFLELELPSMVSRGQPLEGTLRAFSPRRVKGQGIRLVVRSVLEAAGKRLVLSVTEAVVVGRASHGWLKRFKLWSREPSEQLLLPGLTPFELSFDPTPLAWNGPLPDGDGGRGPRQYLAIDATLDAAGGVKTETQRVRILDGRRPPSVLAEGDRLDLEQPVRVPALSVEPHDRFVARPITHGQRRKGGVVAVAQLALRHDAFEPQAPIDALDLELEPLTPSAPLLRGVIRLDLHRPKLSGRLTLSITVERKTYRRGTRDWRAYAREAAILCEASADGVDVAGKHTFRFEAVIPPSFHGGRPSDPRRVRVRALLVGEGTPLRSAEREILVRGKSNSRRRARRDADL